MSPEKKNSWKIIVDKRKYEQSVSECNKLRTFIKIVVGRNITVLLKTEYDHVWTEYGEIINASEISNGDDSIDDVWNKYNQHQVPDIKCGKYQNSLLTDDDIKLSIPSKYSGNFKYNFPDHKCKHNVSLTLYHETN